MERAFFDRFSVASIYDNNAQVTAASITVHDCRLPGYPRSGACHIRVPHAVPMTDLGPRMLRRSIYVGLRGSQCLHVCCYTRPEVGMHANNGNAQSTSLQFKKGWAGEQLSAGSGYLWLLHRLKLPRGFQLGNASLVLCKLLPQIHELCSRTNTINSCYDAT